MVWAPAFTPVRGLKGRKAPKGIWQLSMVSPSSIRNTVMHFSDAVAVSKAASEIYLDDLFESQSEASDAKPSCKGKAAMNAAKAEVPKLSAGEQQLRRDHRAPFQRRRCCTPYRCRRDITSKVGYREPRFCSRLLRTMCFQSL